MTAQPWKFWIDVGGTFTDCVAIAPDGNRRQSKVLSSSTVKGSVDALDLQQREFVDATRLQESSDLWSGYRVRLMDDSGASLVEGVIERFDPNRSAIRFRASNAESLARIASSNVTAYEIVSDEPAPLLAIRLCLRISRAERIPAVDVRLGTTRGTNALLTRTGAATALVTTKGFVDLLEIGHQDRPHLFELSIQKYQPLYRQAVEANERIGRDGTVIIELDELELSHTIEQLKTEGIESLAICLMHADQHPKHEQIAAAIASRIGFANISVSHQVSPTMGMIARAQTTVLDAYLNPVLRSYIRDIEETLGSESRLRIMTSSGGLVAPDSFTGKNSLLSGPAGGVVGYSNIAAECGYPEAIGFDMGGTSTDVSRFDGEFELEFETVKAGVAVCSPQMAIETVAAGGGSICRFEGGRFLVGPASAGSDPGPACYGRGGPLTVTDINLFLGRIDAQLFPWRLDPAIVHQRLETIVDEVKQATGERFSPTTIAEGFRRVANLSMSNAIRSISVAQGYDPRDYLLCGFGGAAGQHVCSIADELEMTRILIPANASVMSAVGIGYADITRHRVHGFYCRLDTLEQSELIQVIETLRHDATRDINREGIPTENIRFRIQLELRYLSTSSSLLIPFEDFDHCADEYHQRHLQRYGYQQDKPLELVAIRLEANGSNREKDQKKPTLNRQFVESEKQIAMTIAGSEVQVPCFDATTLQPGSSVAGPAAIVDALSTVIIEPAWEASTDEHQNIWLTRETSEQHSTSRQSEASNAVETPSVNPDPVLLEVFNNNFQSVATEMGTVLRQTAASVNVKERLDYSCALFTSDGDLVVNAPHIPVHLGAMSQTVKSVLASMPDLEPGDVIVTNDPFLGGSHLPDVTVVSPIFDDASQDLICLTASRAHHAEIGGRSPGSMPPDSTNLAEEGVIISNFRLLRANESNFDKLRQLLVNADYPSRNPEENLADIRAQLAANQRGQERLLKLIDRYSIRSVLAYMRHIQSNAEEQMRNAIRKLTNREMTFADHMDDGSRIAVRLRVDGETMTVDFSGTSATHPLNLNANRSIVTAALLYVMRCLIDDELPLNDGILKPIEVHLPTGLLNPKRHSKLSECPAMVGGNVETSQRVVDVLLGALQLAAASQGTMNNLIFGDDSFGYYETICGGAGATPSASGADAVHTHMTNTRITDPEVIEHRFPVRLRRFSIRRGSGGNGVHRGGDGAVREIEFLSNLKVSLLTQRRGPYAPYGINGGDSGALGENYLLREDQPPQRLAGQAELDVEFGDRVLIMTPGGGGWGQTE